MYLVRGRIRTDPTSKKNRHRPPLLVAGGGRPGDLADGNSGVNFIVCHKRRLSFSYSRRSARFDFCCCIAGIVDVSLPLSTRTYDFLSNSGFKRDYTTLVLKPSRSDAFVCEVLLFALHHLFRVCPFLSFRQSVSSSFSSPKSDFWQRLLFG